MTPSTRHLIGASAVRHTCRGTLEDALAFAASKGWTDGLPIIPPTEARVRRMVEASDRAPNEVIAVLPPRQGSATVERIAANAVMAGCHAEYMPVLIAVVEAVAEPDFNLLSINTTTSPVAAMVVINGPIRHALDINSSYGFLGPGWRANATIGRAVRLILLNIAGAFPGAVSKSTMGQPGRYTMCFAENEEASPWPPLHVELGYAPQDSTVTVFAPTGTCSSSDTLSRDAKGILTTLGSSMDWPGIPTLRHYTGRLVLVLNPDHAAVIARDGLSKDDAKRFLFEYNKRIPLRRFSEAHQVELTKAGRVSNGTVQLTPSFDTFMILVAGGPGGHHSCFMPTFAQSLPVTKVVEFSENFRKMKGPVERSFLDRAATLQ